MHAFGCRMLYFPCHPILAQGSLVVGAIHGGIQDLQSTLGALRQGKGPFRWATHQILGVTSKKMRSESSFGASNAHTMVLLFDAYTDHNANNSPAPWGGKYLSTDKEVKFGNKSESDMFQENQKNSYSFLHEST